MSDAKFSGDFFLLFEFRVFSTEPVVLLDKFDDIGMESEDALIEFEIVNFLNGFGNLFCVVQNSHSDILACHRAFGSWGCS